MDYLYDGICLQNRRQSNMDSLLLKGRQIDGDSVLLAVVCDGVGSLTDGAFASGTAVRMLNDWFTVVTSTERIGLTMRDAVLRINAHIVTEAKNKKIDTASTLSALLLVNDNFFIVHIGDSRIYSFENERLSVLTNDDISPSGRLTAYIGRVEDIVLQYSEGSARGKTFLLCSDGLYKRMNKEFIIDRINIRGKRELTEFLETLTRHSIECGEQDNISLALVKIKSRGADYEN